MRLLLTRHQRRAIITDDQGANTRTLGRNHLTKEDKRRTSGYDHPSIAARCTVRPLSSQQDAVITVDSSPLNQM
jgi:hypothetical protein